MAYTESDRLYFQRNKKRILEKRRKKKRENPEWAAIEAEKNRGYSLKWYHKNKEKLRKNRKAENKEQIRRRRNRELQRVYGLSIEDYDEMFSRQKGRCAICGKQKKLCVDHDHSTGKVRSLLCRQCNTMLGNASDDFGILMLGAIYLEEYAIG